MFTRLDKTIFWVEHSNTSGTSLAHSSAFLIYLISFNHDAQRGLWKHRARTDANGKEIYSATTLFQNCLQMAS